MNETWLPVIGYEGLYEVSDLGRVRRAINAPESPYTKRGYVLKPILAAYGYYNVSLCDATGKRKAFRVHRLVMITFVGPRPNGYEVNHIDANKSNNALSNLEYVTPAENLKHAFDHGLQQLGPKGELAPSARFTEVDVREMRRRKHQGEPLSAIARTYRTDPSTISKIVRGLRWAHVTE
jgi:hypothetical protein